MKVYSHIQYGKLGHEATDVELRVMNGGYCHYIRDPADEAPNMSFVDMSEEFIKKTV